MKGAENDNRMITWCSTPCIVCSMKAAAAYVALVGSLLAWSLIWAASSLMSDYCLMKMWLLLVNLVLTLCISFLADCSHTLSLPHPGGEEVLSPVQGRLFLQIWHWPVCSGSAQGIHQLPFITQDSVIQTRVWLLDCSGGSLALSWPVVVTQFLFHHILTIRSFYYMSLFKYTKHFQLFPVTITYVKQFFSSTSA